MMARGSLGPFGYGPGASRRVSLNPWNAALCRRTSTNDAGLWRPEFLVETAKRRIDALTQSVALNAARDCILGLGLPISDRSGPDVVLIRDRDLAERMIDWLDGLFARTEQSDDLLWFIMHGHARMAAKTTNKFALRREGNRRSNVLSVALMRTVRRMLLHVLKPVRHAPVWTATPRSPAVASPRVGTYAQ